jgi:hypothetical protein
LTAPEPIKTTKRRRVNGEPPPPKPRAVLPPEVVTGGKVRFLLPPEAQEGRPPFLERPARKPRVHRIGGAAYQSADALEQSLIDELPTLPKPVKRSRSKPVLPPVAHEQVAAFFAGAIEDKPITLTELIGLVEVPTVSPEEQPGLDAFLDRIDQDMAVIAGRPGILTVPGVPFATREAWMLAAITEMTPWFEALDVKVPPLRVSIGWPGGRGSKAGVVGECWHPGAVTDHVPAIFVSPIQRDPKDILETILHEMVHGVGMVDHQSKFAKVASKLGMIAPWTSTPSSPELIERLADLALKLGPFDHSAVNRGQGLLGTDPERPPVQGTRMLKCVCEVCGYTARTTRMWLDLSGAPLCPAHNVQMVEASKSPIVL